MGKVSWTERVENEVLRRVQDRNILNTINRKKDNCTGLILRKNCLLKHVIEGKIGGRIEVTRRLTRRLRPLLDDLKEKIGYSKLKKRKLYIALCVGLFWKRLWTCSTTDYGMGE
jgi:hypothetical protein